MCLIAVVKWHWYLCVYTSKLSVLPRVTGVICFPFSPTVLIDDHSLFHTNTLLLSRVHYSKTLALGKRGHLMGKHHSSCALHKVTVELRGPSFIMKTLLSYTGTQLIFFKFLFKSMQKKQNMH